MNASRNRPPGSLRSATSIPGRFILNVLALLALPFIFSSAFEITEVSTRSKLRAVENAGGLDQEKLAPFLAETKRRTGYKQTCDTMGAWLTKDQPWQRALLIPSALFLVLNTVALCIARILGTGE